MSDHDRADSSWNRRNRSGKSAGTTWVLLLWWVRCRGMEQALPEHGRRPSPLGGQGSHSRIAHAAGDPGSPVGAPASSVRTCLLLPVCPLLARPADGALQAVGQLPIAAGADGPLRVAVRGGGQSDRHVPVGVRADDDLPSEVLAADQPPRGRLPSLRSP